MMKRCLSCGGEYETEQKGGTYFHACAPVFNKTTKQFEERKDHRDENIVDTGKSTKIELPTSTTFIAITKIKSEGKGSEEI